MKIGLHPLWLNTDPYGGIATYWLTLIQHLGALDNAREYTVYVPEAHALAGAGALPSHVRPRVLWPKSSWLELPISLPMDLLRRPLDLLHVQSVAPPFCPVPFVQTLNDLAWETHPEVFPPLIRFRLSRLSRAAARRAQRVLTVSEYSKGLIVERYGIAPDKIAVTHHGVSETYRLVEDPHRLQEAMQRYGIQGPFVLYVGKLQARKNISRLLHAFHSLVSSHEWPHRLVLVGKRTWASEEAFATLQRLGLGERVQVIGQVPPEDLPLLYNAADLFVFPSLAEGFGIPPLEAMACGTPVVASNTTSLPEVVGDAGLQVDPCSVPAITQAMHTVLSDENLRRRLRQRGLQRVTGFSNRRMAELTLRVYEDVLSQANRAVS